MKEFREEIRKLKAMIVKHENRIRALEAKQVTADGNNPVEAAPTVPTPAPAPAPITAPTNNSGPDEMAPDEV